MPKLVDHEQRRRELAKAAVRVIARDGLEAATTRAVATESGWSTGVLKHYFDGRDDILRYALRELEAVNADVLVATSDAPTGLDQLQRMLSTMSAGDRDHAKVWLAFVARAASDRETATAMRRGATAWNRRWQQVVERGQLDGSIRSDVDAKTVAHELWALLSGLRMASLFVRDAADRADGAVLIEGLRPTLQPTS